MPRTSPTVRKRMLARELRRLRAESGVSAEEAARVAETTRSTYSRWESGEASPTPHAVRALATLYGVPDEDVPPLVQMARDARKRGWWAKWHRDIPEWARDYVGLESEATVIEEYQPLLIPGLLQTAAYAEAIVRAERPNYDDDQVKRVVELRMQRQNRDDNPELWAIVSEAALRIPVGGRDVMRAQLEHLIEEARRPRRTVQVLPDSHGAHGSMGGMFIVLHFGDTHPPVVYTETRTSSVYIEDDWEVREYTSLYRSLTVSALSVERSVDLIRNAIDQL